MQDGGGTALWPSAERMAGDAAKKVNGDVVQTAGAGRAARSRFYSVILGFSAFYLCAIGLSCIIERGVRPLEEAAVAGAALRAPGGGG